MIVHSAFVAAFFLSSTIGGLTACHSQPDNASPQNNERPTIAQPRREAPSTFARNDHEPYLFELVQKQPYRDTYTTLIKGLPPLDYLGEALDQKDSYQGLYSASEELRAGDSTYRIAFVCPADAPCSDYGAVFLFTSDGKKAWAEVRDGDKVRAFAGNPSDAQKRALDKKFEN